MRPVILEAVHTATVQDLLCKVLTQGFDFHDLKEDPFQNLTSGIKLFKGNLNAQLTASACVARLASQVQLQTMLLAVR